MTGHSRFLTKSRFLLATQCPRKLFYTGKPEYLDRSTEDSFLAALADGGFQVGALAQLMYPGGVLVGTLDSAAALARTAELLKAHDVTVFEAALSFGQLLVRVDILHKRGDEIELIEVKAKSYRAQDDGDFRGRRGDLKSGFLPYLRDVAFQRHVASQALPRFRVKASLLLVDKERRATVDGLNQRFKVGRVNGRAQVQIAPGTDSATIGGLLLVKLPVDSQVDQILAMPLDVAPDQALTFSEAVDVWSSAYAADQALPPTPSPECAKCQFKAARFPQPGEKRSGFHKCWAEAFRWAEADFAHGTVLDLWKYRGKKQLIADGVLKLDQVTMEHLAFDGPPPGSDGLSDKHRQWYTCRPDWPGGGAFYFGRVGYRTARSAWRYPLHCIDFETSAAAIPFVRGRRPYETTAFQFSHHVMEQDGRVQHRTQFLLAEPGADPNLEFVRALRDALSGDAGTIFRWADHENTVLCQLREQLMDMEPPPSDLDQLVSFVDSITTPPKHAGRATGSRSMVDLSKVASKFYFHPLTQGSNSLKKVLPALMQSSAFLREQYRHATYGGQGVSLNFIEPIAWWQEQGGQVLDPYLLLPPIFDDLSPEEQRVLDEGLSDELREGGAAMVAYGRLQFEELPDASRRAIKQALLRYCELDTLAMIMALQAWNAEADG